MSALRHSVPAALLLSVVAGVLLVAPQSPYGWTAASAQSIVRPAGSDRIYLGLDGVSGEATDGDHVGELVLQSFTWSESHATDTSSRVQFKDIHVIMGMDKAAPWLLQKAGSAQRIAKATLTLRNSLGQDYARFALGDITLTGFQIEATAGQARSKVSFDMNIGRIDMEYRPQLYSGGLGPATKGGWDRKN